MVENPDLAPVHVNGLSVVFDPSLPVASLRYFDRQGPFARTLHGIMGDPLPENSRALSAANGVTGDAVVLAWRSPTETLVIGAAQSLIETLQSVTAPLTDGCIVDQRGGAWVLRASGKAVADLFARLAGHHAYPSIGESRRSRLADVAVSAVKVELQETLLIVERSYGPHLMAAIRVNAADLVDCPFD